MKRVLRTVVFACLLLASVTLANAEPTLFRLGSFDGTNGEYPCGSLYVEAANNLYGTAANGEGVVSAIAAGCKIITDLASFDGSNGAVPLGGRVTDEAGNLYGTTNNGESNGDGPVSLSFKVSIGAIE